MKAEKILFTASADSSCKIAGFISPATNPAVKGVIQICHGMADYFGRYEEMVDYLNNAGWHVCGMDMMGHGQTYMENKDKGLPKGYFGKADDSALCILKDEMAFHKIVKERYPDIKTWVLYGHSMGSFVCRNIYITPEYNCEFDRFIFASTMGPNPAIGVAKAMAKFLCLFGVEKKPNKFLDTVAFGSYNKRIPNPKTSFDWLTSDEDEVAKYMEDDLAGFIFTTDGFIDLATLVGRMQTKANYINGSESPAFMPMGEDDPVTGYAKGAMKAAELLKLAGKDIRTKNYGHYRHELHNESIRGEYFKDIEEFASGN